MTRYRNLRVSQDAFDSVKLAQKLLQAHLDRMAKERPDAFRKDRASLSDAVLVAARQYCDAQQELPADTEFGL